MAKPNRAAMIKDEAKKSILLLPAVILLVCFFIVPIILTVYYSFTNMALTGANAQKFQFVGDDYCCHRMCIDPFYCWQMDSRQHSVHGTGHVKECQHSQRYYDFRHNPSDQDTRSYNTTENAMKQYATSVANAVGEENTTKQ